MSVKPDRSYALAVLYAQRARGSLLVVLAAEVRRAFADDIRFSPISNRTKNKHLRADTRNGHHLITMKHKDPWDPFSRQIEHDLNVERLARGWRESRESFVFLSRMMRRGIVLAKGMLKIASKTWKVVQFGGRKRVSKVPLK